MRRVPPFWRAGEGGWRAALLAPLGALYGAITARRMRRSGASIAVPVISVGNFTAGGAGKTPAAIAIAAALSLRGEQPFFVLRGYGGREAGPLRVDPAIHAAGDIGDEPLLLARHAPAIVARDRRAGAALAAAQGASVIILDDALQNPALAKDFSLAIVDGGFGLGNERPIPAGPLRASVPDMLPFTDAVLVVGKDRHGLAKRFGTVPVFSGALRPDHDIALRLAGVAVIAFSGIGLPEKFEATLMEIGAQIIMRRRYPDHHPFTAEEARELIALADEANALLVTTEKDRARMEGTPALDALRARALALPVTLSLPEALLARLYGAIEAARSRARTASGPE